MIRLAVTLVSVILFGQPLAQRSPALGSVTFPNSGAPQAQADFLRGVAWLHSFGYEEAIEAFRAAQNIDPAFALAYWGEALAFNQPLWFHEDVTRGRAVLAKLGRTAVERAAKAKTAREQAYLGAVEALYGAGDKRTRDTAYSDAMSALAAKFPHDDEAQAFYALSLLAMLPRGTAALPMRQKAGAIVEGVFKRNQKHPGAAHYILHAYDDSTLAAKALPAARVYAQIAPAASHALHMPAHVFVQLGYWDEAAATDQASWDASVGWAARKGYSAALRDFHSLAWLQYEWTQQGRFSKTAEALRHVNAAMTLLKPNDTAGGHHYSDSEIGRGSGPMALRNDRGSMRARYIIESERWSEMKGQTTFDNVDELFALGLASVKLGDQGRAAHVIGELEKLTLSPDEGLRAQATVMFDSLGALMLMARRQTEQALAAITIAVTAQARMPTPIGRPYPPKGADEIYAELLLAAGRAPEAVTWFERTLTRTPNRSRAVLGLARAAAKAGDLKKSRAAYQQFLTNWRLADAGLAEVAEARAALQ